MLTALLSAFKKDDDLRDFARALVGFGWDILASSGTKKFLDQYDIPSIDVGSIVGEPILGHRVVTLDRRIYAALLARKFNADDAAELDRIGMRMIDLVYVDLYPLADELAKSDCTFDSVIEKTDIGGPTLLRAAAKGRRLTLCKPSQFENVLGVIGSPAVHRDAQFMHKFLSNLAADAEETVAEYATLSANFHRSVGDGEAFQ